jgi:D-alanyl-lipoteichoic acid acyltransferase DltB (MBOAT superfamily)
MNPTSKERFMYIIGGFVIGCAVAIIALLVFYQLPETNKDIVNISLGTLLGMAVNVVGFFFGSSKSSQDKTDLMAKAAEKLAEDKTTEEAKK